MNKKVKIQNKNYRGHQPFHTAFMAVKSRRHDTANARYRCETVIKNSRGHLTTSKESIPSSEAASHSDVQGVPSNLRDIKI
jgi:hypothetical protein